MLSGICRFVGLVFCDFSGNFFQNAFQTYICGLILGPCFCRNPFLWGAIDFRFFLSRFRYLLWILEFLLFLLLCFFVCLLCCFSCFYVFLLLCLFVFPVFPLFCFFPVFLLLCFSCFPLFCFPVFLLLVFPASLLSASDSLPFYFYLFFSAVMRFHDISKKDKNTQIIPIFRVISSRIELCKHL